MPAPRFRHELKYAIPLSEADKFFEALQPYCHWDEHAGETRSYEIASVYYDTPDLRFYSDREESVGFRRKVRLRTYNTGGEATAMFLEIKEKHQQFVSKKRLFMKDRSILENGIEHIHLPLPLVVSELEDCAEAREFEYLSKRLDLVPVVLIRYIRKAMIPSFDHDMRITLDTRITAGGASLPEYDENKEEFLIAPDQGVLEIKSNQGIPLWLHSIMERFQFVQTRYSKYCLGVDAIFGTHRPWVALATALERRNELEAQEAANEVEVTFDKAV